MSISRSDSPEQTPLYDGSCTSPETPLAPWTSASCWELVLQRKRRSTETKGEAKPILLEFAHLETNPLITDEAPYPQTPSHMAVGQNQWDPIVGTVGAPPISVYLSGHWDVDWGTIWILTHGHIAP